MVYLDSMWADAGGRLSELFGPADRPESRVLHVVERPHRRHTRPVHVASLVDEMMSTARAPAPNGVAALILATAGPGFHEELTDTLSDVIATHVGPLSRVRVVTSASAASLVAVGLARAWIRTRVADEVWVCAFDDVEEEVVAGLRAMRALGTNGCRPFMRGRDGIELTPAIALARFRRTYPQQQRGDALAVQGCGCSSSTASLTAPSRAGIEASTRTALNDAGWRPESVDLVKVHGAGTVAGDVAELEGLGTVFGKHLPKVGVSAPKSILNHTQGCSGLIELGVAAELLVRGWIHGHRGADHDIDERFFDLDFRTASYERPLTRAVVLASGLGGAHVSVALERLELRGV